MTQTGGKDIVTDAFPTDALSWLMATCSKLLRESLLQRFTNAGYQVTPDQWAILARLGQQDGISQQALADRFHRSKVSAFQLISRLEKQGLVARRSDPGDDRSNLIFLTPEGRAVQSVLVSLAQENMDQALDGISDADLETAKSVVRKIIVNTQG
jgi:DNA-binding MarR family transcriptional regulator